jgi:hypothetical protein
MRTTIVIRKSPVILELEMEVAVTLAKLFHPRIQALKRFVRFALLSVLDGGVQDSVEIGPRSAALLHDASEPHNPFRFCGADK